MKSKPNILFVNIPSIPFDVLEESFNNENTINQAISMPMGLLYLSSYIKKYNDLGQVKLLDYIEEFKNISNYNNVDELIMSQSNKINFQPDIIAISLIFSTAHKICEIYIKNFKFLWPNATIIVGGTHATCCVSEILRNKDIDYVIRGEGEIPLSQFIKAFADSEPINIKGIYSRDNFVSDKQLVLGDLIENLDELPFPDWDLINFNEYINSPGRRRKIGNAKDKKLATLITTRGCPYACTYCAAYQVHGRKVRFRSPENVAAEIKYLYEKYGINIIIPEDDMFTVPKERCLEMLKQIKELNIPGFEIQVPDGLSVNTLDNEILDMIIDSGVKVITLAIESGSKYVQKNIIKKNCNLEKAKDLVKYLKSKDIIVRCYFILGFFKETKEQMLETIDYAKNLGADWSVFNIATPLLGTEMYYQMVEAGYFKNDIEVWTSSSFSDRQFDTPEISAKDLKDLLYTANLECNFINNVNKINKNYNKAIEIYEDIITSYPFHIIGWYCLMECYEALENTLKVNEIKENLFDLIKKDNRSKKMYEKYNYLMPKLKLNLIEVNN